jgi:hypothetical protein
LKYFKSYFVVVIFVMLFSTSVSGVEPPNKKIPSSNKRVSSSLVKSVNKTGFIEFSTGGGICQGNCDHIGAYSGVNISGFYSIGALALGIAGNFQYLDEDNTDYSLILGMGVEGRYYFNFNNRLSLFCLMGGGLIYQKSKIDYLDDVSIVTDNGYSANIGFGLNYLISQSLALGFISKYYYNIWDKKNDPLNTLFFGLNLNYYF